jgi:serine/threonine-protein kinase
MDRSGDLIAGKWRLISSLGNGGAGSVYVAEHHNGKRVALKLLNREFAQDGEVRKRFLFEPIATNRVRHRGVVSVHDDGVTTEGLPFFIMDLVEGETLEQIVEREGPLHSAAALALAAELLDILVAVHAAGVVHLDVKPSNVLISKTGQVFLLDFGVARVAEGPNFNRDGLSVGTPMFMSPEQANADWTTVDERSDLWGVGAVVRYALTGKCLRTGTTLEEVMKEAREKPVSSARNLGLSPVLSSWLNRALAFRPERRFACAQSMLRALEQMRGQLHLGNPALAQQHNGPPASVPVRPRSRLRAASGACAVALLLPAVTGLVVSLVSLPAASNEASLSSAEVASPAAPTLNMSPVVLSAGDSSRAAQPHPAPPSPTVPPAPSPAPVPTPAPTPSNPPVPVRHLGKPSRVVYPRPSASQDDVLASRGIVSSSGLLVVVRSNRDDVVDETVAATRNPRALPSSGLPNSEVESPTSSAAEELEVDPLAHRL